MKLGLRIDEHGRPEIDVDGRRFVGAIRAAVPIWESGGTECASSPWEEIEERNASSPFARLRSTVSRAGEPILEQTLANDGSMIVYTARLLDSFEGIACGDSFERPSIHAPRFQLPESLRVCLATYGLGSSDDPCGGYWPSVRIGGAAELPSEAFAPLVVFSDFAALAIAPGNHFLTSGLVSMPDGVARGLHGAVDRLAAGLEIETLFVPGRDLSDALIALGEVLLGRSGKARPDPASHVLTSSIGWWNAYGGCYTEPLHPLTAAELRGVIDGVRQGGLPVRYLGLDLWYPYRQIGQAIEFIPDPKKYPDGIGPLTRSASLPTVLHVSALAQPNAYGSDGSDGGIYERIAEEIRRQEGVVVWHDWMRTQQHLTPRLRNSPAAAEAWYREMTDALGRRGLDVLQCMQTMGMALASTQAPNVRSARTYIDYLFALPEAIESLAELGQDGFRREALRPVDLNRQNLLMGTFLYALGLLPFHDLFLSAFHPGLGGTHPEEDAVLRALSCGPVGIGDAPDRSDKRLLSRLILPDGRLLQPDRPPFPVTSTLGAPIEVYWTLHRAGEHAWLYVVLLNLSSKPQPFDVAPPLPGPYAVRNGLDGSFVERMRGTLEGGRMAYYVLSPIVDGICPLGLVDKFVPAPSGRFVALRNGDGLQLQLDHVDAQVAFLSEAPIDVAVDGRRRNVQREGDIHAIDVSADHTNVEVRRR